MIRKAEDSRRYLDYWRCSTVTRKHCWFYDSQIKVEDLARPETCSSVSDVSTVIQWPSFFSQPSDAACLWPLPLPDFVMVIYTVAN